MGLWPRFPSLQPPRPEGVDLAPTHDVELGAVGHDRRERAVRIRPQLLARTRVEAVRAAAEGREVDDAVDDGPGARDRAVGVERPDDVSRGGVEGVEEVVVRADVDAVPPDRRRAVDVSRRCRAPSAACRCAARTSRRGRRSSRGRRGSRRLQASSRTSRARRTSCDSSRRARGACRRSPGASRGARRRRRRRGGRGRTRVLPSRLLRRGTSRRSMPSTVLRQYTFPSASPT